MSVRIEGDGTVQVVRVAGSPGPAGPPGPPGPPGPAGAKVGAWLWSTQTATPPNTAQLRSDSGAWDDATALALDTHTVDNVDVAAVLPTIVVAGDEIHVQQKTDGARWARFAVTATPVDHGGYVAYAVACTAVGGASNSGAELRVAFVPTTSVGLLGGG